MAGWSSGWTATARWLCRRRSHRTCCNHSRRCEEASVSIRRLAIVNRGEPALRALAAVAELNSARASDRITTIAVHTDPDIQAWYVRDADEAISLGPATFVDPADATRRSRYLDEPAVIA